MGVTWQVGFKTGKVNARALTSLMARDTGFAQKLQNNILLSSSVLRSRGQRGSLGLSPVLYIIPIIETHNKPPLYELTTYSVDCRPCTRTVYRELGESTRDFYVF